jgi:hypothetical protein
VFVLNAAFFFMNCSGPRDKTEKRPKKERKKEISRAAAWGKGGNTRTTFRN